MVYLSAPRAESGDEPPNDGLENEEEEQAMADAKWVAPYMLGGIIGVALAVVAVIAGTALGVSAHVKDILAMAALVVGGPVITTGLIERYPDWWESGCGNEDDD